MPLYQYKCPKLECKHEFEQTVSLKDFDTVEVKCPNCGTEAKRDVVGPRTTHSTWKNWRL